MNTPFDSGFFSFPVPVISITGYSGSGKTTLLKQVIPLLVKSGIQTALIKHAHHKFDIDKPGKDSYELRQAGAQQVMVASSKRWALMREYEQEKDPSLSYLLKQLDYDQLNLVIVEGFKHEALPKIEVYREANGKDPLYPDDDAIVAIATDSEVEPRAGQAVLDLNKPEDVVQFICEYCKLTH